VTTARALLTTAALALALLTGCTDDGNEPAAADSSPSASSPSAEPARPAPRPEDGRCYALAYDDAVAPTTNRKPVPCSGSFTARTFHVGDLDTLVDGHLLAVDSARVRTQLATECPRRFASYVGGSPEDRRLSMLSTVWFSPTVRQSDAGQSWYRCDVVAVESEGRLAPLSGSLEGVLDTEKGRARYGVCGTAEPGTDGFERVICGEKHAWQAVSTVDLPGSTYPAKAPASVEAACKDAARDRADDALSFDWGYELPTKAQWERDQHYALCWAPS
jgi:putative regulator of septum formation